jgi:hypothetical protein
LQSLKFIRNTCKIGFLKKKKKNIPFVRVELTILDRVPKIKFCSNPSPKEKGGIICKKASLKNPPHSLGDSAKRVGWSFRRVGKFSGKENYVSYLQELGTETGTTNRWGCKPPRQIITIGRSESVII